MIFLSLLMSSFSAPHKGSGVILENYINHISGDKYIFRLDENNVRVFLKAYANDLSSASFVFRDGNKERTIPMKEVGSSRGSQYFFADVPFSEEEIEYFFLAKDKKTVFKYLDNGRPFKYKLPFCNRFSSEELDSKFWYQIMIDRFRNGNPYNNSDLNIWNSSWSEFNEKELEFKRTNSWYVMPFNRVYGGDIYGIIEKIDYLYDLGVDVLLLSPIFLSNSTHKQDVLDHKIFSTDIVSRESSKSPLEEYLSGNINNSEMMADFSILVNKAHERGMKIFIEFPLNVSEDHFAHREFLSTGNKKEWFFFDEDGNIKYYDDYEKLLMINYDNEEVLEYLNESLQNLEKVGVDGIMVTDISPDFKRAFSSKSRNLSIVEFPTDLNSSFNKRCNSSFNIKIFTDLLNILVLSPPNAAMSLRTTLKLHQLRFPKSFRQSVIRPLSSIDQERAISAAFNFEETVVRYQENPNYKLVNPALMKKGRSPEIFKAIFSLFLIANDSFMFAYGDEIGMWGASDPDCRKPMIWEEFLPYGQGFDTSEKYNNLDQLEVEIDKANKRIYYNVEQNKEIKKFVTRMLDFRKANKTFFKGAQLKFMPLPLDIESDVLVAVRGSSSKVMVLVINLSGKSQTFELKLPYGEYMDIESEKPVEDLSKFKIDGMVRVLVNKEEKL